MFFAHSSAVWRDVQAKSHARWNKKFGGQVFIVASAKIDGRNTIANAEIIPLIQLEIARLKTE